jgi:hypothetical protein
MIVFIRLSSLKLHFYSYCRCSRRVWIFLALLSPTELEESKYIRHAPQISACAGSTRTFSTMDELLYPRAMDSVLSYVVVVVPSLVQYFPPDVFFPRSFNHLRPLLPPGQRTHKKLRTRGSKTEPSSYPITS